MKKVVQDIMLTKKFVIGLKTASFLYGFASLLAATFNFMFPFTEKEELVLQFCLILAISSIIHFLISYFSSEKNYKIFLGALIIQIMLQGILMNKVNMADIAYTINIIPSGISGRLVDYAFFFPTLFLAVSIVLFRIICNVICNIIKHCMGLILRFSKDSTNRLKVTNPRLGR